ncbi:MAG TPA: 50S ribosomal protein L11 methyltransferase [Pyrinomonadaceae bacterium]|nr:50S ribosomal protein L11 methyltransferase [Pyrinomonadaceae bacterium]
MTVLSWAAACAVVLACAGALAQEAQREVRKDVPYVPTPQEVVDEMLRMANVGKNDVVYDLGCGDGRLVITAVKKFGAKRGVGVDIDPQRIKESNENARAAGVTDRVKFVEQNLFETDFKEATVVTLYLLPDVNLRLRPKLWSDLKPGTRVVSHAFDMGDWQPEKTTSVDGRMIYFWTIPATKPPAANPSDDLRLRPGRR